MGNAGNTKAMLALNNMERKRENNSVGNYLVFPPFP